MDIHKECSHGVLPLDYCTDCEEVSMSKLKEFSNPYVKTLDEKTLITLINSKGVYGDCTKQRAMYALSTLDPNFTRTSKLITSK